MSTLDELRLYLAERDVPCPGCNYNLRGLTGDRCPECARRLSVASLTHVQRETLRGTLSGVVGALVMVALLLVLGPLSIGLLAGGLLGGGVPGRRGMMVLGGLGAASTLVGAWYALISPLTPSGNIRRRSVVLLVGGLLALFACGLTLI